MGTQSQAAGPQRAPIFGVPLLMPIYHLTYMTNLGVITHVDEGRDFRSQPRPYPKRVRAPALLNSGRFLQPMPTPTIAGYGLKHTKPHYTF